MEATPRGWRGHRLSSSSSAGWLVVVGVVFLSLLLLPSSASAATTTATAAASSSSSTEFRQRCRHRSTPQQALVASSSSSELLPQNVTEGAASTLVVPGSTRGRTQVPMSNINHPLNEYRENSCQSCPRYAKNHHHPNVNNQQQQQQQQQQHWNEHNSNNSSNIKTHAVILLESPAMRDPLLTLAAGLLRAGHAVTIVTGPALPPNNDSSPSSSSSQPWILDPLFRRIPCDAHAAAAARLVTRSIVAADPRAALPCPAPSAAPTNHHHHHSPGDVLLCRLQNSVPVAAALRAQIGAAPDAATAAAASGLVLIVEASSAAGLLVAERLQIPAVALVEPGGSGDDSGSINILRHVLGTTARRRRPDNYYHHYYRPSYWMAALSDGIQDRLTAIDMTNAFVQLNRIRALLGLKRVRRVVDLWRAGGSLLLVTDDDGDGDDTIWWSDDDDNNNVLPNLLRVPNPLLPPCIPCTVPAAPTEAEASSNATAAADAPTIVVSLYFSDAEEGRLGARRLMQGLEIARRSVRGLVREHGACGTHSDDDEYYVSSSRHRCWSGPSNFRVVPIVGDDKRDDESVALLPDFYAASETEFLDAVARHQPVAIVSSCNATNAWMKKLGPPVLCLESEWEPREVAFRLLSLWWRNSQNHRPAPFPAVPINDTKLATRMDGLEWTISLIEQLGTLKRSQSGKAWRDGWEMGRSVRDLVRRNGIAESSNEMAVEAEEASSPLDILVAPLAWIIILSTALYVPFRESTYVQRFRARRLHLRSYQNLSLSALVNDFWFRLPDVDRVWQLWCQWFSVQLSGWEHTIGSASSTHIKVAEHNHCHPKRKRNASKKRH